MRGKGFTLPEIILVFLILLAIAGLAYFNFQSSQVKSRDAQRKADLKSVARALDFYKSDFGRYPRAEKGRILACGTATSVSPCRWGFDRLQDLNDPTYEPYLDKIPTDPLDKEGYSYLYLSSEADFLLMAGLEGRRDPEYNQEIAERELSSCGEVICNFAIGSQEPGEFFEASPSAVLPE